MKHCPRFAAAFVAGLLISAAGVRAQVTVIAPKDGAVITLPRVWVRANTDGCYGQPAVKFGYSIDNSSVTKDGKTLHAIDSIDQTIPAGPHILHIKSWTRQGECPRVDIPILVVNPGAAKPRAASPAFAPLQSAPPTEMASPQSVAGSFPAGSTLAPSSARSVPPDAISSGTLDGSGKWLFNHDPDTPGTSQGWTLYPVAGLTDDNAARQFRATYTAKGGEIFHLQFTSDIRATHFIYDANIMLDDPKQLQNLELDMNQVMADGRTVIFGTQCSSGSGTWEYTTVSDGHTHWHPSNIRCNVQSWPAKTWRHIQIASERDSDGNVTYDWVCLDGACNDFQNAWGLSAEHLGWSVGHLLLNFQLDGSSHDSGEMTAYVDKLTIYRW